MEFLDITPKSDDIFSNHISYFMYGSLSLDLTSDFQDSKSLVQYNVILESKEK